MKLSNEAFEEMLVFAETVAREPSCAIDVHFAWGRLLALRGIAVAAQEWGFLERIDVALACVGPATLPVADVSEVSV